MVIFKIEAVVVRQWNSRPIDHLQENRMNVIQFLFLSPLLNNLPFTGEIRGASTAPFPWKGIWSVKVPKRVSFFLWTIALGKILTLDNLTKTGMSLVSWCCMCRSNGELVDHILIHCDVAYALWGVAFQIFRIQWIMLGNVSSLLFSQRNWFGKHGSNIWNMVLACLMWLVWKEWYRRTFEDMKNFLRHEELLGLAENFVF